MKQTVNFNSFVDAFNNAGRQGQFSYEALEAIFGYIEDYEQDSGEEIELDVIALCREWTESTISDLINDYDIDWADCENDEEILDNVMTYLECETTAILLDNGNIVYVNF
jgi:hypothetical protein